MTAMHIWKGTDMRTIDNEELKTILCDMLDDFAAYCDANGYRYLLDYGSLLGAVRHHGFIPWDDDMDIMMPRDDYEKILTRYPAGRYKILHPGNHPQCQSPWAKIVDTRTSSHKGKHYPTPVSIDIYPVDRVPRDPAVRQREKKIQRFLVYALYAASTPFGMSTAYLGLRKTWRYYWRSFVKNAMIAAFRFTTPAFWGRLANRLAVRHHDEPSDTIAFVTSVNMNEMDLPLDYFDHRKQISFDGHTYWIPEDYDNYLAHIYGDYMTPPPAAAQQGRHVTEYYWKE